MGILHRRALRWGEIQQPAPAHWAGSRQSRGLDGQLCRAPGGIKNHGHRVPLPAVQDTGHPSGRLSREESEKLRSGEETALEARPVSCT